MARTRAITERQVKSWVDGYVKAWTTGDPADVEALFTEDAESYEWPYETAWIGRQEIIDGWQTRAPWQEGGWTFDWSLLVINGDTFAIKGTGVYAKLGTFDNLWVVTLDAGRKCTTFRMWNNEV
ncbi:nuclear transport factor 2 family protein [Micromonospora sp. NBC_01796]|uniref:nuclear transport factor 2 family protein n=1 Tax=Micromonospora sp. NBC_01796 TaxID=2975987 RepID=UPI002DDC2339|nr:nuclear transport factor 2 family protein [Micromonospora sp. NBC_01796]WSA87298.1 nuclear transport factor 2 family protein [Micromonospora sp. NBC_01796]